MININKNLLFALYIALLTRFVILQADYTEGIQKLLNKIEENVINLKDEAEFVYHDKSLLISECKPSYHQCTEEFPPGYQCDDGHGTLEQLCEGCNKGEMQISYEHSTFSYPQNAFNPNNITSEQRETICIYKEMEKSFIKYGDKRTNTYLSTYDGMFRIWPMISRDRPDHINDPNVLNCRPFDPRLRPWYIAASTGNKDVIILVDTSLSMIEKTNEKGEAAIFLVRNALENLLETFSLGDFINVVEFNQNARALHKNKELELLSMRKIESVIKLKEKIKRLTTQGEANFKAGFEKAFDLFEEALKNEQEHQNNEYSSDCTQVLILFTDGQLNEKDGVSGIIDYVSDRQNQLKEKYNKGVNIFTYTIGSDSDDFLARVLACKNRGDWTYIDLDEDEDDILNKMNSYFIYIADGKYNQKPVWTYPYEDDYGLGLITSCALPFYITISTDIKMFLGVIAVDILLSDFIDELGEEETEMIIDELFTESSICTPFNTSACKLQALRSFDIFEDNGSSVCVDDLDESECYSYTSEDNKIRYYIRYTNATIWTDANNNCIKNGGILTPVRDEEKHMHFLASISKLGSWIGLKYSDKSNDTLFTWTNDTLGSVAANYSFSGWVPLTNFDIEYISENQCVTIDYRGSNKNMKLVSCEEEIEYICEFEDGYQPNNTCNDKNTTYEFKTSEYKENPYIGECTVEKQRIEDILVEELGETDLSNTDVCHPLSTDGKIETTFKDRTCCGCRDKSKILTTILTITACLIIVVIIIYLIYVYYKWKHPFYL